MPAASNGGILFLLEASTRSGSPTMLLHLLRWLKANSTRRFSVLVQHRRELNDAFAALGDTMCAGEAAWDPSRVKSQALLAVGLERIARRLDRDHLRRFAARCCPALIYSNSFTQTNFLLIERLQLGTPVLTHVHETGFLLQRHGGNATAKILSGSAHFIACSNAVRENLIRNHAIAPGRVDVVHEAIPVAHVKARRTRADVLRELGFPEKAFVVAGCGMGRWNKGMDVFLQLGRLLCQPGTPLRLVWVGGGPEPAIEELQHDAHMLAIGQNLRFTGPVENTADYLAAADVFALTSREDSYPLACLEAAALGKPIVCFADAGGMPEFVEEDCGFVVPYLDVQAMADRIARLLNCPACPEKMGAAARRKVAERHDISIAAPRIAEIIERTIQDASR